MSAYPRRNEILSQQTPKNKYPVFTSEFYSLFFLPESSPIQKKTKSVSQERTHISTKRTFQQRVGFIVCSFIGINPPFLSISTSKQRSNYPMVILLI